MALELGASLLSQLESEAIAAWPDECCGMLVGMVRGGRSIALRVQPIDNIDDVDRTRRFTMDPQATFDVFRTAAAAGEQVIGFYHSHPDGSTNPSRRDVESAWPDKSCLIVGVSRGKINGIGLWRLTDDELSMHAERIELTSNTPL